jgi:Helix-turn-helix domain
MIPADYRLPHNQQTQTIRNSSSASGLRWWDQVDAMRDLTHATRKILRHIIRDTRSEGYCYRSQGSLAAKCGCDVRTVQRAVVTLHSDDTIRVHARYRTRGRGRTTSAIYINWEHPRFRDCPTRSTPPPLPPPVTPTPESPTGGNSCPHVLPDIKPEQESIEPVYIPTVVVSQEHPTDQNPPVEVEEVQAFAAGCRDRKVTIRPGDVVFLLALLIQAEIDKRDWLVWVEREHNLRKARNPRALLRHLVGRYRVEHGLRSRRE